MNGRYTSEQLKKIAMGTMFLDHAAVALIYNCGLDAANPLFVKIGLAMRLIGRVAFPLYAFLLVQGFLYTKSWKRYLRRVVVFALISEIPYNLVVGGTIWDPGTQNTMMTMCIGLLCMKGIAAAERRENRIMRLCLIGGILFAGMFAAEALHMDYGAYGILLIGVFYLFRHRTAERMGIGCILLLLMYNFTLYGLAAWIAIFFINHYNGERGRKLGMVPYAFYPLHLLVLFVAELLLGRMM